VRTDDRGSARGYRFHDGSSQERPLRPVATILDRYRRGAAVPAVPAIDLASELAPVFAALDEIEAEADGLRQAANDRAARLLVAAAEEASAIVADAERRARAERLRAAAERRRTEEVKAQAVAREAEAGAEATRSQAAAGMPGLVEAVLACIKESPA
jgi:vacuolar-type H+-ATPase subunit H